MRSIIVEGVVYGWCAATMEIRESGKDAVIGMAASYSEARAVILTATGLTNGRPWLPSVKEVVR